MSNANNFAIYWRIDEKYKTFKNFSSNVSKGDFICFDKQSDNDWDHFGFVVEKGKYRPDKGYTNFRVAQHSSNYLNWVTAKENGWENIKTNYPKTVFGIVRP